MLHAKNFFSCFFLSFFKKVIIVIYFVIQICGKIAREKWNERTRLTFQSGNVKAIIKWQFYERDTFEI
jgi:hypothetical protein